MDSEFGELRQKVKALEQWREERDRERSFFRRSWSDQDIDNLRIMLTTYSAAAAVRAFWKSFLGKLIISAAVLIQMLELTLATLNFYAIHHK